MTTISRRDALRFGAAGLALAAAPSLATARQAKKIGIAVQLYSVRDVLGKDFEGTLKLIAGMGFEGVEFAGNYGKTDAAGLKKILDGLGLKAAGAHVGADRLTGDKLKASIDLHKAIGCAFLIVPGDGRFTKPDQSKEYAEFMNKLAETLKADGLFTGHHNHTAEFAKGEGDKTYWDLFAERTSKDVILQQDMGHTMYAGIDPTAVLKKHPGRTRSTHIKCRPPKGTQGKKPFVGEDFFDWKGYITACYEVGGTEWFTIEQEEYPDKMPSMDATKISLDNFKRILKEMGK